MKNDNIILKAVCTALVLALVLTNALLLGTVAIVSTKTAEIAPHGMSYSESYGSSVEPFALGVSSSSGYSTSYGICRSVTTPIGIGLDESVHFSGYFTGNGINGVFEGVIDDSSVTFNTKESTPVVQQAPLKVPDIEEYLIPIPGEDYCFEGNIESVSEDNASQDEDDFFEANGSLIGPAIVDDGHEDVLDDADYYGILIGPAIREEGSDEDAVLDEDGPTPPSDYSVFYGEDGQDISL